jgi:hypothetical protein
MRSPARFDLRPSGGAELQLPTPINWPPPASKKARLLFASWLRSSVVPVLCSLTATMWAYEPTFLSYYFLHSDLVTSGVLCGLSLMASALHYCRVLSPSHFSPTFQRVDRSLKKIKDDTPSHTNSLLERDLPSDPWCRSISMIHSAAKIQCTGMILTCTMVDLFHGGTRRRPWGC